MTLAAGTRMFARYAHAPNALGYCGPESAAALLALATGHQSEQDVTAIARQFSGAWPYQVALAKLAGVDDPLDSRVTRGYWTGNALTDTVDRREFGRALLETIGPRVGHYWTHLDDDLLVEAAPTHAFHVLSVYPWSRMLTTDRPEPLNVLDSCRIGWARVLAVESDRLQVVARHLEYVDGELRLGGERTEEVDYRVDGESFVDDVEVGDHVAVHWGFVCDRLAAEEVADLERWTRWQLDAIAPRLRTQKSGSG